MPGMFGMVSKEIGQQAIYSAINQASTPYTYDVKQISHCRIAAHAFNGVGIVENEQKIIAVDGVRSIYSSLSECPESLYNINGRDVVPSSRCKGNICIFDKYNETLYLAADLLNSFPLYYAVTKNSFVFSSRIKPLGKFLNAGKDDTGVFEFLLNGYNINDRTFYGGVFRVRAGELIKVDINTLKYDVTSYSMLWANTARIESREQLVEKGSRLLKESFPLNTSTMLMMSAGWDSRTILAAGLISTNIGNLKAYIHGDLSSREVDLVGRICGDNNINLIKQPICSEMFAADVLQKNLDYTENVVFPHWHWAGERAREYGFKTIAAGIFGEALGGHYGPPMAQRGVKRILSVFRYLLKVKDHCSNNNHRMTPIEEVSRLIKPSVINKPWYINNDYWETCNIHVHDQINSDIDNILKKYQQRGIVTLENLIEAFLTEHRGGQYISAQLQSCRHHIDICLPFAEPDLIKFATQLPFDLKVHNIMNQAIIRNITPSLLGYPMAATLIPATYPMLLQEASRALRKILESSKWAAHKASKGLINEPRMGWVNFQFLEKGNKLEDVVDLLVQPYWDRDKMLSYIRNIEHTSLHPISDMLMKILTVDYCVSV